MKSESTSIPIIDLVASLHRILGDEQNPRLVRTDLTTRLLYSTDASIYQIEALEVVFPHRLDDLPAMVD